MIGINIVKNDTDNVGKIVIIDEKNRVLLLKRSQYVLKFSGEWDLPGGHIKEGEPLTVGLAREVKEETRIDIEDPVFLLKQKNIHFFYVKYNSQPVELSHEHVDYKFFEKNELDIKEKFQKVAIMALEAYND